MRWTFALAGLAALAACVETKPIEAMGYEERKALAAEIMDRCMAQGVKPNTPEMMTCAEAEIDAEAYARADANARKQAYAAAMLQANVANQQRQRMNCTSTVGYGAVNTSCY